MLKKMKHGNLLFSSALPPFVRCVEGDGGDGGGGSGDGDDAGGATNNDAGAGSGSQDDNAAGSGTGGSKNNDGDGDDAPWDDDDFDAKRAAKLLKNLRAESAQAKADRDKYKKAHDDAETAKLSDLEKSQKERDDARAEASTSQLEAARLRAAIKYSLDEEDLEFIHGKTPDEVDAAAKKYSDRHSSGASGAKNLSNRPKEKLRGGGDPTASQDETDPTTLAAQIPRR